MAFRGAFSITVHEPISAIFRADGVAMCRNRNRMPMTPHRALPAQKMPQNRFHSG